MTLIRMGYYVESSVQIALIFKSDRWKHTPFERPYIRDGWLCVPKSNFGSVPPYQSTTGLYRKLWSVETTRIDPIEGLENYPQFGEIDCVFKETDTELKVRIPVLPFPRRVEEEEIQPCVHEAGVCNVKESYVPSPTSGDEALRAARDAINAALGADDTLYVELNEPELHTILGVRRLQQIRLVRTISEEV